MKVSLRFGHLTLGRKRFEIAHGVRTETDVFVVRAESDGLFGLGSGTPSALFSDSPQKCRAVLDSLCRDNLEFEKCFDTNLLRNLRERSPSATAAVDIAMYDLRGRLEGKNLSEMLGGKPSDVAISSTIDLACRESAGSEAKNLARSGFKIIKVKIGKSISEDIQRIFAIREGAGAKVRIIADANCGYSFEDAVRFLDETVEARLDMLEQPIGIGMLEKMAELRSKSSGVRICADESMADEADLKTVIEADAADIVNIKLMKCGGIQFALEIKETAKGAGVETMIGSMGDIGLSIVAAAHISSSLGMLYSDLDSFLNIEKICDGPEVEYGNLHVPSVPGIGVSLLRHWASKLNLQFNGSSSKNC